MKNLYSTGRRKTSSARVFMKEGKGIIMINNLSLDKYFFLNKHRLIIMKPFLVLKDNKYINSFDYYITVKGGGISSQSIAIRHGISRVLLKYDNFLKSILKKLGFLTRDSRKVERKKYGLIKSRSKHQYSKR